MTFNGLGLLAVLGIIAVGWFTIHYLTWRNHIRYERFQRRVHVNLVRATGTRR